MNASKEPNPAEPPAPDGGFPGARWQPATADDPTHPNGASRATAPAGRERLMQALDRELRSGARLVDLGCGSGSNLSYLRHRLFDLSRVDLVDPCPPLLAEAALHWAAYPNVVVSQGDAARFSPSRPVDAVCFSYALSMIEDWRGAIDNALAMLEPGGILAVLDYGLAKSTSDAPGNDAPIIAGARPTAWPEWFAADGIHPDPAQLETLQAKLDAIPMARERAPWRPAGLPYYLFLGRKRRLS